VISGMVKEVAEDGTAQVTITAVSAGEKVLGQARATVRPGRLLDPAR